MAGCRRMKKVLMMLTSHRLDCFRLTMDSLMLSGELAKFDKVVLLLSGVTGRHLEAVQDLMRATPQYPWDTIAGPRGKGRFVSNLQNECVRRYPGCLYFKIDEDLVLTSGWVDRMTAAYEAYQDDPRLSLLTPVVTNNATGFHFLLTLFPELATEYTQRFGHELTHEVAGPVWKYPGVAEWIIRKFLDLREGNERVREALARTGTPKYGEFAWRFSINNLVYDQRHWDEIGGIPDGEEPAWAQWVVDHGKVIVLVRDMLIHHYTFFVQNEWLDRTSLLEDLRMANLPQTLPARSFGAYTLPRLRRVAKQVPGIVKRRLGIANP